MGDADPLTALWAERSRIAARLRALDEKTAEGVSGPLVGSLVRIDDRIAAAIPRTPAGAVVQLRLLQEHLDADPFAERLVGNLIAGLVRLDRACD
jgi:hypothetical protein